ncbi:hypothetical protein ACJJTC_017652 [Scirpophaga incertulas]
MNATSRNVLCYNMDVDEVLDSFAWCKEPWNGPLVGSKNDHEILRKCGEMPLVEPVCDLHEVIRRSDSFPLPFPIESVRLKTLKKKIPVETLNRNVQSTYPIIHERVLLFMATFLDIKRLYGSDVEKQLYKDMELPAFIDRLLTKRAASFIKAQDEYLLLSGERG